MFQLTRRANGTWTEKVLHSFNYRSEDGAGPLAGMVFDASGNLYGTTTQGGANGSGIVFRLKPGTNGKWTEKVLYNFTGGADGGDPYAGLIFDGFDNLYGTTFHGGASGYGTVFELTTGGAETVLYSFQGGSDGVHPTAGLVFDADGNLYGTTTEGGMGCPSYGCGTVYELSPQSSENWAETVLYSFAGEPTDGSRPTGALVFDASGNLYGSTVSGGSSGRCTLGCGTVFRLAPAWTETVLHSFTFLPDGALPGGSLVLDAAGNLYGTTSEGGASGDGTVFEITP